MKSEYGAYYQGGSGAVQKGTIRRVKTGGQPLFAGKSKVAEKLPGQEPVKDITWNLTKPPVERDAAVYQDRRYSLLQI